MVSSELNQQMPDGAIPVWRQRAPQFVSCIAALALTVAIAGCGPNGATGTASGGNAGGTSGVTTVHLAFFPNVTHAVALVGTGKGTFARALGSGVNIEEQLFNAGPSEIEAIFGNQVDIGYIGPGPAVNGYLKSHGAALKVIAGASSGGTALVVRNDSGIADVRGLAGKRVAVPQTGGTQDISLRHALQTAGLNSTDKGGTVNVLPNAPADTLTLFVKKELDAAWITEPWVSRLVNEGNGKVLQDERDLWTGRKFATTVVIVRSQFLKEHPDLVTKFLEAHVDTVDWIAAHRDEATAIVGERLKKLTGKALPADVLKSSMERTDLTYDPLRDSVLTFADWSKALGYLKDDRSALGSLIDVQPLNAVLAKRGKPAVP
jgi:NitT/TauT family transport system substrate-binding protein